MFRFSQLFALAPRSGERVRERGPRSFADPRGTKVRASHRRGRPLPSLPGSPPRARTIGWLGARRPLRIATSPSQQLGGERLGVRDGELAATLAADVGGRYAVERDLVAREGGRLAGAREVLLRAARGAARRQDRLLLFGLLCGC